jgi:hypothetical protein
MDTIGRGIVAGFIATVALSLFHEPIQLLAATAGTASPAVGLLFHFFVGTLIWGSLFGLLHDHLWGPSWVRGIEFAVAAAAFVLLAVIPVLGVQKFAMILGITAPIAIVLFHVVYGALLGGIYSHLDPAYDDEHDISDHHHPVTR